MINRTDVGLATNRFDGKETTFATGGTISFSGSSTVHTFATSSSFIVRRKGVVNYIVTAGGTGGQVLTSSIFLSVGSYTVTIGADAQDSVFGSITATAGEAGGSAGSVVVSYLT